MNNKYKLLLIFAKTDKQTPDNYWKNFTISPRESTMKAKELYEWAHGPEPFERAILDFTQPGDWILDPFAGSGTILAVARKHLRKCVGVEKEERPYNIMKKRLADDWRDNYAKNQEPATEPVAEEAFAVVDVTETARDEIQAMLDEAAKEEVE